MHASRGWAVGARCGADAASASAYTGIRFGTPTARTDIGKAARYEVGLVLLELPGKAQVIEQGEDVGLIDCARAVGIVLCEEALGLFIALLGHGNQVARG